MIIAISFPSLIISVSSLDWKNFWSILNAQFNVWKIWCIVQDLILRSKSKWLIPAQDKNMWVLTINGIVYIMSISLINLNSRVRIFFSNEYQKDDFKLLPLYLPTTGKGVSEEHWSVGIFVFVFWEVPGGAYQILWIWSIKVNSKLANSPVFHMFVLI